MFYNALPLRRILLDGLKDGCVLNVTAALTNVMNDMDSNKNSSVYPGELHRAMQNCYNIIANEQRDMHESFTTICSDGKETGMNDVVASHFNIRSQFRKTCTECGSFEDGTPEMQTSLYIPVLNGINGLEKAVETSLKELLGVLNVIRTRHTCKSETLYSFQKHWHCALHDLNYRMALQKKIMQKSNYRSN